MNVQIIDREPRGTDTRFAVGSDTSLSSTIPAVGSTISLSAEYPVAVFDPSIVLDVADLSAHGWWVVLGSTASSESTQPPKDIATEFKRLADKWREDTEGYSSMVLMAAHDSYLAIVRMGWLAVPLILRDMRDGGGHWYKALRVITEENPVTPEMVGNVPQMDEAWLAWGHSQGFV